MPEMRRFVVTETREVKVSANSCIEAAQIAQKAFDGGQKGSRLASKDGLDGIWGDTNSSVRQIEVDVREGYK